MRNEHTIKLKLARLRRCFYDTNTKDWSQKFGIQGEIRGENIWGDHFHFATIERSWKNNAPSISCIPEGCYEVNPRYSEKYNDHFEIPDVPGRTHILIHSGNVAGEGDYKTHSTGCILVGTGYGVVDALPAVVSSRIAMKRLLAQLKGAEKITIDIQSFVGAHTLPT